MEDKTELRAGLDLTIYQIELQIKEMCLGWLHDRNSGYGGKDYVKNINDVSKLMAEKTYLEEVRKHCF